MNKKLFRMGNRGSGIVLVLVSMSLIIALGATLLLTSYTGYRIRISQRSGEVSFYDAETAMSEVRSGIQEAVTASIAGAYSDVLTRYNSLSDTTNAFQTAFAGKLYQWRNGGGSPLFLPNADGSSYSYDPSVLEGFVSKKTGVTVSAAGGGLGGVYSGTSGGNGTINLRGVSVSYSGGGYTSNVSSDITIALPKFTYSISEYRLTGVPEFAMIARNSLTQQSGGSTELELTGNAYAGKVELALSGNTLTVSGGTLISAGDVTVNGSGAASPSGAGAMARLVMESDSSLWAGGISVGSASSVDLRGDTYVANDLDLAGRGASAKLAGRYYGFGYIGDALASEHPAESSSSIVVNGLSTSLDLSGVNTLMLAGHSFIRAGGTNSADDVMMGQSVSVKSDQLAYLLPRGAVTSGGKTVPNPYVFTGDEPAFDFNYDQILWGTGASAKTLGNYIATDGTGVRTVRGTLVSAGNAHIDSFYMSFPTRDAANAYFRDYFQNNTAKITEYLRLYSDTMAAAKSVQSSGSTYGLADGGLSLIGGGADSGILSVSAGRLGSMFGNYCITLSSSIPASSAGGATNPFDYVVNTSAVAALPSGETTFRNDDGDVVAVIVKDSAAYSVRDAMARYPKLCLVVSTGDVNVDYESGTADENGFRGLVISNGTVNLSHSLYAKPTLVTGTFTAKNGGATLGSYLNLGTGASGSGGSGSVNGSSWAAGDLVSYSNWKKF